MERQSVVAGCGYEDVATATELLKHDHEVIETALAGVERLSESRGEAPLEVWKKALDFISNFVDRCHHLKEEKILFPALEERGMPSEGGPIGMMLAEHEEGRGYVKQMSDALERAARDPQAATVLRENALAYARLLRQHIAKENEILFSMADGILTAEEQKELLRAFEEHEQEEMGSGVHGKYLEIAAELGKYDAA